MQKKWTIRDLFKERKRDLSLCTSDFERGMCKAICDKEIKKVAKEISATRKLTIAERKILQKL